MSVTFWAPDAPTETVTVPGFEGEAPEQEERSLLPTLNLSNANAVAFLTLVGLPPDFSGELEVQDFDPFIQRVLTLRNNSHSRISAQRPHAVRQDTRVNKRGTVSIIEKCPRTVDFGLHDHQLERYLSAILDLLVQARQGGYRICWG